MSEEMIRIRARIYGKVQGVFYRLSTQAAAQKAGVTGWVRNMADGSVEAVFEGNQEAVDTTLQWCYDGPDRARVERVVAHNESFSNQYNDFSVRATPSA